MANLDKRELLEILGLLKAKHELHLSEHNTVREAPTRYTLIDPLLKALGWDVSSPKHCRVEDKVATADSPDWADYVLLNLDGTAVLVWEAKRCDRPLVLRGSDHPEGVWGNKETKGYVEQALNYAYKKGANWAVLTNGHQLVLLEGFRSGKEHLRPTQARLVFNSFHEMISRADELWMLNRASVLSGNLDKLFGLEPRPIVIADSLPQEQTAIDIYAERLDWMRVPIADIPDREQMLYKDEPELIYTNLLPVADLPISIFSAPTTCRNKHEILQKVGGRDYVPCILREGRLWTFSSFQHTPYPRSKVCGDSTSKVATSEWEDNADKRRWLIELLQECLHEHTRHRNLAEVRGKKRYYFQSFPKTVYGRVRYRSFSNRVKRNVVRQDRDTEYWVHLAADLRFIALGRCFYLQIDPTYIVTEDGDKRVSGDLSGPMITSLLSGERNRKVLYHINFWKAWLADEVDERRHNIRLRCGDAFVSISTQFVSGEAPFSVPDFRSLDDDLDEEVDDE